MGVKPLVPWVRLSHSKFDLVVAICSLLGSSINAVIVMARCRREWQFLLLALWKLGLSTTIGCMSIHRALLVRYKDNGENSKLPFSWLSVYAISIVLGLTGLLSLVRQQWDISHVRYVTVAFWGTAAGLAFIGVLLSRRSGHYSPIHHSPIHHSPIHHSPIHHSPIHHSPIMNFVQNALALTSIFAALYSDWVLGVITGNLVGAPSGDVRVIYWIYWIYFAAKRLPLMFQ
jgi:hypothetical protein